MDKLEWCYGWALMEVVIHWLNWLLPYLWLEHEDPLVINQNCLVAQPNILPCSSNVCICDSSGKAGTYLHKSLLPPVLLRMSKVEYLFITKHPRYDQTLDLFTNGLMITHQCTRGAPLRSHPVIDWTLGEEKNKSAQSLDSVHTSHALKGPWV
jgi:hypothetical protein